MAFFCLVLLSRIPLPELKDSDKLDKIMYIKESTKRIRLGPENLPSICFYSFLNAYQVNNLLECQRGENVCLPGSWWGNNDFASHCRV